MLDIHQHIIRLLKELISIDDVVPCSNVWPWAKVFLCLWHVCRTWAKNALKKIPTAEDRTKILSTLGQIMYSWACTLDHDSILRVQLQINIMATKYPDAFWFIEYLKDHWMHKAAMWCVGNCNIPHVGQDTNVVMEWFHSNMKWIFMSSKEWFTWHKLDWLIFHLVGDVLTNYWYGV